MKKSNIIILLCAMISAWAFSACSPSAGDVIRMDIASPVHNLDPQFATDPTARMILANIFEGLMVMSADGTLRPGAAREYTISPDGLVYVFTLREDARWQDGTPVTAQDFVFAFERMFSPDTPSPFAREFSSISNAGQVLQGYEPIQALGVDAVGPLTVIFTLERPDQGFLNRLAGTPALPSNRQAFEQSMGRYGLEARYVHSNGPFMLSRWDNSRFIHMDRNEYFREEERAKPDRVILYIGRQDPVRQFLDGRSDLVRIPSERLGEIGGRQARFIPVERTVWGLIFNQNSSLWGNPLLRQSLALALEENLYAGSLPPNFTASSVFIPPATLLPGGQSFRSLAGETSPLAWNPQQGRHLFGRALEILGYDSFPESTIYIPEGHIAHMQLIENIWRRELDTDISIELVEFEEISERLRTGNFGVMLAPFSPATENPGELLRRFHSSSAHNNFGHNNPRFDHALEGAVWAERTEQAAGFYKTAESILLESAAFIPLFFETSYYAINTNLTGVEIFPFEGRIIFQNASKG